ncbi:HIT domain-containing protein [Nitrosomonas marina]|uniref:Diadenosine tetraphosphate (Ap4A) hydrolase n=1 Tax=Nitrosomonas marina TaxID=917 RepID=A0A1H8FED6_9PROT|nr:HIT domain-containing protein [Nitrosomonas marina]SEN30089.1 Diadenosine tetraphosphate (Ap4A) hydrolase [Nitrosomonas marina]
MDYEELAQFIKKKMRMSHIYQPILLIQLLENKGKCHEREIATALLSHDESQIEYYTAITNNMVGKVLRNHNVVHKDKSTKEYSLIDFHELSDDQRYKLIALCKTRLLDFIECRGKSVYNHRRKSNGYISGTIKYDVLKRARFRCELCGISAEKKALEVDHILPKNHGGSDDSNNFQALCYSCNAMKRDRDDTDFRGLYNSYNHREPDCLFCAIDKDRIVSENELAYSIRDGYPVTEHHTLVIPKRHTAQFFDLGQAELNSIYQLLQIEKKAIEILDPRATGFNIGVNSGKSAGQTIFHCHIHLIPRRDGDVKEPRGGVRHVIPGKGSY